MIFIKKSFWRPNSFMFYDNIWVLFFKKFSENNIFLKNALIIHCTFPVLFLINNLLIPDMSCISYCLTSAYLNCFYQFLPFIFIGHGFFFTSCHSILVSLSSFLLDYYINVQNTFLCYFVNFIHLILTK